MILDNKDKVDNKEPEVKESNDSIVISNTSDLIYECNGSIKKSENTFNCNKKDGHGEMDLKNALTYSCNPYFIELSCNVGAENLLETASDLGFNNYIDFGNGYMTETLLKIKDFALNEVKINRFQGGCAVENIASKRVIEKCGFVFEGVLKC